MSYSEIHIWGDSLARGIVFNEQKGRYAISRERCCDRLAKTIQCKVANHSNMGATVQDGLRLFLQFNPVPGALCAVEFGGNDCDLDWKYVSEHPEEMIQPHVDLEAFQSTLLEFVRSIRERDMTPLLVTPLPLHAQRYFNWVTRDVNADNVLTALGDVNHIYRWQERYAIAVRNVARISRCKLLDLRDVFLASPNYEHLMCLDGIHPNDDGHRMIADAALEMANQITMERAADTEAKNAHLTAIPTATQVS